MPRGKPQRKKKIAKRVSKTRYGNTTTKVPSSPPKRIAPSKPPARAKTTEDVLAKARARGNKK